MTDLARLKLPSLGRLRRYLRADGWHESTLEGRHAVCFFKEIADLGKAELVLPDGDRPGAETAINQAVRALASIESRDIREVIQSVWSIAYDLIETILPSTSVFIESISLGVAEQILRHSRRVLSRTAQSEMNASSDMGPATISYLPAVLPTLFQAVLDFV